MQRKPLRHFVLRFLSITTLIAAAVAVPTAANAVPAAGVPLPPTWTPPVSVDRTPTGVPTDQVRRRAGGVAPTTPQTTTCAIEPNIGTQSWFPMDRYAISDSTEMLVNRADGNVVITARALTMKGTGLDLSLDAVYNSRSDGGGAFGRWWTISGGRDVYLQMRADGVIFHDPTGYCAEFEQNADGSYVTPQGLHASLVKQADGTFTLTYDSSGEIWKFTADGQLSSHADRNGNTVTYRYNSADGTLASVTDTQGRVTTVGNNTNQWISTITDPAGQVAGNYDYTNSRLSAITDRNGGKTRFGLDTDGRVTSLTTPAGATYTLTYDNSGALTKLVEPTADGAGQTTGYAYNDTTTTVTDPNGHATTYTFDDHQRQTKAVDALGHTRSQSWSAHGDVAALTDGLNNSVTYDYDPLDNLKGGKLPTGATAAVGYTDTAHPHLPTQVTDWSGKKVSRSYDHNGNPTTVHSDGLNADIARYTYNPNGTVATATDGNGHVTGYAYDQAGNLITITPPAPAKPTRYTYDSFSRITSVTDGNGVKIRYGYDKLDHVVSLSLADGTGLAAYGYDQLGNRTTERTAQTAFRSSYDRRQLTQVVRTTGGTEQTTTYHHDRAGNLTALDDPTGRISYGYDAANRLTSLTDQTSAVTSYGYDNAGNRTSATLPGGTKQTPPSTPPAARPAPP